MRNTWKFSENTELDTRYHERSIKYAGEKNNCPGGVYLNEKWQFNGSGESAFGGAKKWPCVTLEISLPENRTDLRFALTEILRSAVDSFIASYHLEYKEEERG